MISAVGCELDAVAGTLEAGSTSADMLWLSARVFRG